MIGICTALNREYIGIFLTPLYIIPSILPSTAGTDLSRIRELFARLLLSPSILVHSQGSGGITRSPLIPNGQDEFHLSRSIHRGCRAAAFSLRLPLFASVLPDFSCPLSCCCPASQWSVSSYPARRTAKCQQKTLLIQYSKFMCTFTSASKTIPHKNENYPDKACSCCKA